MQRRTPSPEDKLRMAAAAGAAIRDGGRSRTGEGNLLKRQKCIQRIQGL